MTRILLIDDEPNIRMMMRLALEQKKVTVETADDGPAGLDKFGDGSGWDLALVDQRMPGMAGLEVLREIRRRKPTARVIMITAFGTVDLVMDAMKVGATDFLRKPFTIETLRGAVAAALQKPTDREPPEERLLPEQEALDRPTPLTFTMTTLNGYQIEFQPGTGLKTEEDTLYTFQVHSPQQEAQCCTVLLPNYLIELVKSHANRDRFPGDTRFWEALCEETLANYLWQHAELPADGVLRITEITESMRQWIDTVLRVS